ncbi:helix-turn-helix transcriptional regulator [Algirhabdus cladophorae]|uniref:helix-turn-helix transcriptional regulator n=1 Tax=Algirhabdus cladophorae TaxID=3377108 RepID=UPI003B847ADC
MPRWVSGGMINFPLPIITFGLALVAAVLVARLELGKVVGRWFFVAFFVLVAVGSFLVGLRFGYGIEGLIPIQRSLPFLAGPLLYLGFVSFTEGGTHMARRTAAHLGFAVALMVVPSVLFKQFFGWEALIGVSYLIYLVALFWMWRKGPNHVTRAPIEQAEALRRWMLWAVLFLLAFFVMDGAIAISFALRRVEDAVTLISYGSVVMFGLILAIIVAVPRFAARGGQSQTAVENPSDETGLAATADAFLGETQLYLDTELTVDRLAKRLHVPARALSAAINQSKGMNVSQYVNDHRLAHAAQMLVATRDSVSVVMEQSGFLTRSNFYREFQRKYGQSPASYRKSQSIAGVSPAPEGR